MSRYGINLVGFIAYCAGPMSLVAKERPSVMAPCDKACLQKKMDAMFRYLDETPTCDNACKRHVDALIKDIERAKRSSGNRDSNETHSKRMTGPVI